MKSITSTTHRAINYGAVLQSLAFHKTQQELGIDNYLLDYPKAKLFSKVHLKHLFSRRGMIDAYLFLQTLVHFRDRKRLFDSFESFVEKNIKTVGSTESFDIYKTNIPEADFYICGSDQVFGIRGKRDFIGNLSYVPDGRCKFSYAASLGEYDWSAAEKETFGKILRNFSMVSVREAYARDYLQELYDKDIVVHLDPVFLFDKERWVSYAKEPRVKKPYILCFPLVGNGCLQPVADELKKKYHCPVVCVQTNSIKRIHADEYICDASPEEFLGLIKNAEAVITTSFHGTAFSVLFEKEFYCLIKDYKSQRMTELLAMLGLSDRIIAKSEDVEKIADEKLPDYTISEEIIRRERTRSIDYLKQCIQIAEEAKR